MGFERPEVEADCVPRRHKASLEIANLLCPGNIAVSGTKAACERVAELAPAAGAMKAMPLAVAGAFHTPIMQPAVERLAGRLADVPMRRRGFRSSRTSMPEPHDDPEEIRELLVRQVVSPCCGKIRCGRYLHWAATSSTKWARGACCAAC